MFKLALTFMTGSLKNVEENAIYSFCLFCFYPDDFISSFYNQSISEENYLITSSLSKAYGYFKFLIYFSNLLIVGGWKLIIRYPKISSISISDPVGVSGFS